MLPLNGTRFHPLSEEARSVLASLNRGPLIAHPINPGIRNRLCGCTPPLAEEVKVNGKRCLYITDAGREHLTQKE